MPGRADVPGRDGLLLQAAEHRPVLAVHAQNAADLAHLAQQIVHLPVAQHERVIGIVCLERGHARVRHLVQLAAGARVPVGHCHVEAVVAGALAVRAPVPHVQRVVQRPAAVLGGKVDEHGRAAHEGGLRAGPEIIGCHRARHRHIQVGVPVDKAREHQAARRVNVLVARKADAHALDDAVFDQKVARARPCARDQGPVLNADGHGLFRLLIPARRRSGFAGPPAAWRSRYRSGLASGISRGRGSRRSTNR